MKKNILAAILLCFVPGLMSAQGSDVNSRDIL